jgi:polysaccharide biosynthesis protein PslH
MTMNLSLAVTTSASERDVSPAPAKPTALVVGLPWLRGGSGKVFQAQMEYFHAIGWNALFVAVPSSANETKNHAMWGGFSSFADELAHFPYIIQTFSDAFRRRGRNFRELLFRRSNLTALDFKHQISDSITVSSELAKFIGNNDIRLIIANHVYTLPFSLKLRQIVKSNGGNAHLATVTHDVQSRILLDHKTKNPWTRRGDNIGDLLRTEYKMLEKSDSLIHVSDDDFKSISRELPQIPHFLTLPPISGKKTDAECPAGAKSDLLFVGSQHVANVEALLWYFNSVAPCYAKEPSLTIVGSISILAAAKQKKLWSRRSQHFIGSVPDVAPYYAQSRVAIAPMVSGRGISIKTIEALAYDKPIVGARAAFRGFPQSALREYGIQYWDRPSDFANAVMATLQNPDECRERGRRLYKALFTFDQFAKSMTEMLTAVGIRIEG